MKTAKCKCGAIIEYTGNRIPKSCPACRKYTPSRERRVFELLNLILKEEYYINNGYYSWLLSPKKQPMQLDRFYPELNFAVEIDGKQHRVYSPYFHKDYNDFLYLQKCDRTKERVCRGKGIKLIRIRHDVKLSVEYLTKRLKQIGVLKEGIVNACEE